MTAGRRFGWVTLFLAAVACAPSSSVFDEAAPLLAPSAGREAEWVVVESPRFEIYSSFPPKESKDLARQLEQFHALIEAVTSVSKRPSAVPTRILALADPDHYAELGPEKTGGQFLSGLRNH